MRPGKSTIFSVFFFLMGLAQTIVLTVLPVQSFHLLGDVRDVSLVYLGVGIAGFGGRLAIPLVVRVVRRLGALILGTVSLCLSGALLATETAIGLVPGLVLNVFAIACFEIVLNLCVLEHIARAELGRFEAKRIFFAAAPWTFGPWLGVWLQANVAHWVPFAISAATACALLAAFGSSRFAVERAAPQRSANPLRYVPRFFAQPRLVLAWVLAAGRSSWWGMFQVYAPIFAVKSGLDAETGGAIVSIGIGTMWLVPLWGWVGRRYGIRSLYGFGYAATGAVSVSAAVLMGAPVLGAAVLLLAAFAAESIDGGGNSLYLRAVHPYERGEMTAVFASYRDVAQLVPPGVFSILLTAFDLPAVFVAGGAMMLGLAGLTRYIPRRF